MLIYKFQNGQLVPIEVDASQLPNQMRQNQEMDGKISAEALNDKIKSENRNMQAIVRMNESQLLLNGLVEIRQALYYTGVAEDDKGTGERPPLKPIFNEENQKKLQFAYLNLYMRYSNYCDEALKEMKVVIPKDIEQKP